MQITCTACFIAPTTGQTYVMLTPGCPHSEAASLWQAWLGDMHIHRFLTFLWQAYVLGLSCAVHRIIS